jgi:DNA-binding GntR family transcriptional regulator
VEFIECDREFHRVIVSAGGNPVLADFYETLRDRQLRMGLQAIAESEQRTSNVLLEHRNIIQKLRSGDAEGAAAAMADHLKRTLAALKAPVAPPWKQRHS